MMTRLKRLLPPSALHRVSRQPSQQQSLSASLWTNTSTASLTPSPATPKDPPPPPPPHTHTVQEVVTSCMIQTANSHFLAVMKQYLHHFAIHTTALICELQESAYSADVLWCRSELSLSHSPEALINDAATMMFWRNIKARFSEQEQGLSEGLTVTIPIDGGALLLSAWLQISCS